MKTYTWDKLREAVKHDEQSNCVWGCGKVAELLRSAPVGYRKALAAALSVAKWKDRRYDAPCGLCVLHQYVEGGGACCDHDYCDTCALGVYGEACNQIGSLWDKAFCDEDKKAKRKMTAVLCDIYRDEYNKLLKGGK